MVIMVITVVSDNPVIVLVSSATGLLIAAQIKFGHWRFQEIPQWVNELRKRLFGNPHEFHFYSARQHAVVVLSRCGALAVA